jgi:hypothetical protein
MAMMYQTTSSTTPKIMHYECTHEFANGHITHSYGAVPVFSESHGNDMLHKWNLNPNKSGLEPGTRYTYKLVFFADNNNFTNGF